MPTTAKNKEACKNIIIPSVLRCVCFCVYIDVYIYIYIYIYMCVCVKQAGPAAVTNQSSLIGKRGTNGVGGAPSKQILWKEPARPFQLCCCFWSLLCRHCRGLHSRSDSPKTCQESIILLEGKGDWQEIPWRHFAFETGAVDCSLSDSFDRLGSIRITSSTRNWGQKRYFQEFVFPKKV